MERVKLVLRERAASVVQTYTFSQTAVERYKTDYETRIGIVQPAPAPAPTTTAPAQGTGDRGQGTGKPPTTTFLLSPVPCPLSPRERAGA